MKTFLIAFDEASKKWAKIFCFHHKKNSYIQKIWIVLRAGGKILFAMKQNVKKKILKLWKRNLKFWRNLIKHKSVNIYQLLVLSYVNAWK